MSKTNIACVLTIAGTDPSGGAGIQADIKSISATGAYAASVITKLVAQNTQGVQSVYSISPDFVWQQLVSVLSDLSIATTKIGMLYDRSIMEKVLAAIQQYHLKNIILDPVMTAKDGSLLLQLNDLDFLTSELFPQATLITPNLREAEIILSQKIKTFLDMEKAAQQLSSRFKTNILMKGGHLNEDKSSDVLYLNQEKTFTWFHADRIETFHTHGTGCTLSSAIASYLAQDYSLIEAIRRAKDYLTQAIASGSTLTIGQGKGPVDHFYFLRS